MFIDPGPRSADRLLNNRFLFEAVCDMQTNFTLSTRHVWPLRYIARWAVASRVWQLCRYNRTLIETLSVSPQTVCEARLPDRRASPDAATLFDDRAGGPRYRASGL